MGLHGRAPRSAAAREVTWAINGATVSLRATCRERRPSGCAPGVAGLRPAQSHHRTRLRPDEGPTRSLAPAIATLLTGLPAPSPKSLLRILPRPLAGSDPRSQPRHVRFRGWLTRIWVPATLTLHKDHIQYGARLGPGSQCAPWGLRSVMAILCALRTSKGSNAVVRAVRMLQLEVGELGVG